VQAVRNYTNFINLPKFGLDNLQSSLIVDRLPFNGFQHFQRETFRYNFQHRIALVGASYVLVIHSVHLGCMLNAFMFTVI